MSIMNCLEAMNLEEYTTDDYGTHLVKHLKEFRDEGLFCDFTLTVENQSFKVHKAVLAGCSDYFRAMFSHGMVESNKNQLELKSVPTAGIGPLIEYAYTGKMYLNLDIVPDILAVSTFLQVTPAIKLCSQFLKAKMTFSNADNLVALGESFGLTELQVYRKRKILENFEDFSNTEHFLQLEGATLCEYLIDDDLKAQTEAKLLRCALKWYNYDKENREPVIHEVMDKIRYALDGWPTIDFALHTEPFKSNKKCKQILVKAEDYMRNSTRKHLDVSHRTRVRYGQKTLLQMGGMRHHKPTPVLGFELPGDEPEDDLEMMGSGKNNYYHQDLEQWFPIGMLGNGDSRSHNPMVEVNDHAILVGGYLYTSDFVRSFQHCSNEVKLFTSAGFALWDLTYLHEPRAHHIAVHTPGYIYAVGGKNEGGPLRSVEQYNLEKAVWVFVAPLPGRLYDHAGATFHDKVFVSGGLEEEDTVVNNMWCYHPGVNEWQEKPPMLQVRAGHTMARLGDQLIVCGGKSNLETGRCLSSVESYSLELEQWSFLTPMRMDCAYMTPVVLGDKMLVCGGENSVGDLLTQIQEYDPVQKKWGTFCHLPLAMKNVGICALTIKMTETGEEDRDSLLEAYEQRWDRDEEYYDYEDNEEDLEEEFEDWRINVQRHHWPHCYKID